MILVDPLLITFRISLTFSLHEMQESFESEVIFVMQASMNFIFDYTPILMFSIISGLRFCFTWKWKKEIDNMT